MGTVGTPLPAAKRGRSPPAKFSAHFYCGQTAGCIKMPLSMEIGLSPSDFVLDGDPAPPLLQKGRSPPIFRPTSIVAKRSHGSRCHLVRRPRPTRHCVRWGPSYPQIKGHTHPTQFLAHVYFGQTAGWMKTPLGTEVEVGSCHIVLDVVPDVRERGTAATPLFAHIYCGHGRP